MAQQVKHSFASSNIPGAGWPVRVGKSVSSRFNKTLPQKIRRATTEDSVDLGSHIHTHTQKKRRKKMGVGGFPFRSTTHYKHSKQNIVEQTQ